MITRIDKKNEDFFLPLLPKTEQRERRGLLRIGVTDERRMAAGALTAVTGRDDIEITSIYVYPDQRRKGYGRALTDALLHMVEDGGYGALSAYLEQDEGTEAFLRQMGFEIFEGMELYRVRLGEIMRSDRLRDYLMEKDARGIREIASLDTMEKKGSVRYLTESSILPGADYDPEYSTVCVRDGKITSAMLAQRMPDGMEVIWTGDARVSDLEAMRHMMVLVRRMEQDTGYNGTSVIRFMSDSPVFRDMLHALSVSTGRFRQERGYIHGIKILP